jgi:hypothetical protein
MEVYCIGTQAVPVPARSVTAAIKFTSLLFIHITFSEFFYFIQNNVFLYTCANGGAFFVF